MHLPLSVFIYPSFVCVRVSVCMCVCMCVCAFSRVPAPEVRLLTAVDTEEGTVVLVVVGSGAGQATEAAPSEGPEEQVVDLEEEVDLMEEDMVDRETTGEEHMVGVVLSEVGGSTVEEEEEASEEVIKEAIRPSSCQRNNLHICVHNADEFIQALIIQWCLFYHDYYKYW